MCSRRNATAQQQARWSTRILIVLHLLPSAHWRMHVCLRGAREMLLLCLWLLLPQAVLWLKRCQGGKVWQLVRVGCFRSTSLFRPPPFQADLGASLPGSPMVVVGVHVHQAGHAAADASDLRWMVAQ